MRTHLILVAAEGFADLWQIVFVWGEDGVPVLSRNWLKKLGQKNSIGLGCGNRCDLGGLHVGFHFLHFVNAQRAGGAGTDHAEQSAVFDETDDAMFVKGGGILAALGGFGQVGEAED